MVLYRATTTSEKACQYHAKSLFYTTPRPPANLLLTGNAHVCIDYATW